MVDDWQPVQADDWQPVAPQKPISWSEVPGQAAKNALPSAGRLVHDMAQPFLHPYDTLGNIHKLISGAGAKFGYGEKENEPAADAVGQFFKDRYGSVEGLKKTLAEDPVGALADASTVLTGGAGAAARIPGAAGRFTSAVGKVGRAIDPIGVPLQAAEVGVKTIVPAILGSTTGAGMLPIQKAAEAGMAGGSKAADFVDNMRGHVPAERVVDEAKSAIGNMATKRGQEYVKGMKGIKANSQELSFEPLANALIDSNKVKNFHGEDLSPSTSKVRSDVLAELDNWRQLAAYDHNFATPAGFDALKQKIGDIKNAQPHGTPQRAVANQLYADVRKTITDQAPEYGKVMEGYARASDKIEEIERGLSQGRNAGIDTGLRKLQSVMRNNVNTNYGYRTNLVGELANAGAPNLMEKLAGQSLNAIPPRGLSQLTAGAGGLATTLAALTTGSTAPLLALGLAPLASPRVVGEAAHLAGKAGRALPSKEAARIALIAALNEGRLQHH